MKKYKVEIVQTEKYVVDVLAESEQEATDAATAKWNEIAASGIHHYHQEGDTATAIGTVYDITNTDDPFNP